MKKVKKQEKKLSLKKFQVAALTRAGKRTIIGGNNDNGGGDDDTITGANPRDDDNNRSRNCS